MREEFEKVFPVPHGVVWNQDAEWYAGISREYYPDADDYQLSWAVWQAATALQAERVRGLEEALAELQRKYDAENEPDCYSEDGDYWFDCPNDIELVEGKKVGDRFCLLGGFHALPIQFTVTKAPDDESDDYEVEQALSATARENK